MAAADLTWGKEWGTGAMMHHAATGSLGLVSADAVHGGGYRSSVHTVRTVVAWRPHHDVEARGAFTL